MHRLDVALHTSIQFGQIHPYYPPPPSSPLTVSVLGHVILLHIVIINSMYCPKKL